MSTELAKRDLGAAFELRSFDDAVRFVEMVANTAMVPEAFRGKPAELFAAVAYGAEVGMTPMQALRSIHVIKGTPIMKAEARLARVMASPACEYLVLVESTDAVATWEAKRRGAPSPVRMSYTIEQAKRAGQTRNPTWQAHPEAMLRWAAVRALTSAVFPDVVGGLPTEHDVEDLQRVEVERIDAREQAAAKTVARRTEYLRSGPPAPQRSSVPPPAPEVVETTARSVAPQARPAPSDMPPPVPEQAQPARGVTVVPLRASATDKQAARALLDAARHAGGDDLAQVMDIFSRLGMADARSWSDSDVRFGRFVVEVQACLGYEFEEVDE